MVRDREDYWRALFGKDYMATGLAGQAPAGAFKGSRRFSPGNDWEPRHLSRDLDQEFYLSSFYS
jgi:hypothetical protein